MFYHGDGGFHWKSTPSQNMVDGQTLYMLQLVLIMEYMDIEPQEFGFYQEQQECTSAQQSMQIQHIALTAMLYLCIHITK